VDIRNELKDWDGPAIDDMKRQLDFLLPKHAVSIHGSARLKHLPRYIQAMKIRLEDMGREPAKDEQRQITVNNLERQLSDKINSLPNKRANARAVKDIQWLIQELRVSLFAQRLGTAQSVSERKISKAISALKA
jgi:ATP-dependent helicase HrpA